LPTSKTDALALLHDVQYLQAHGNSVKTYIADWKAINQAPWDLQGLAMKTGLFARSYFDLPFNTKATTLKEESVRVGDLLMERLKTDPKYTNIFRKYNIDISQY